jgi:hypothetical protein
MMTLFHFLMSRIGQPVVEVAPTNETDPFHILHEGNIRDEQIKQWVKEYYTSTKGQSVTFDVEFSCEVQLKDGPYILKIDNIPNPGELRATFMPADQP